MECDTPSPSTVNPIDKRTCYERVLDDYNKQGPGKHSLKGAITQMEGVCGSCKKIWGSSSSTSSREDRDTIEILVQDRLNFPRKFLRRLLC